jgi:competence ComEA-like helix-hairpin-helix protein
MKGWFTFFKSEQTGIAVVLVASLTFFILPRFFRNDEITSEDMERLKNEMDVFLAEMEKQPIQNKSDTLFMFDPNEIDSASLVRLGFSPRQVKSIVNYRNKGGKFYNKESFGKSFVVSENMYARLYYYIDIKQKPYSKCQTDKAGATNNNVVAANDNKKSETVNENTETASVVTNKEADGRDKKVHTIELNSANFDELQKFRGIGEYYAKKIVEYRHRLGGFYKPEQLMEIKGIDSTRFEMFRNQITIDTYHIQRININTATDIELSKHPYINKFTAKAIISYRNFKGKITSASELLNQKLISDIQMEKIAAYILIDN